MSWYQTYDGSGSMPTRSNLLVDGCLAVDPAVLRPEHDLAGLSVDQPSVLVPGLVSECVGDLLQIKTAEVKHRSAPDRTSSGPR